MMMLARAASASVFASVLWITSAAAQVPGGAPCQYIVQGAVLTAGQWNLCFEYKQDFLGYTPLNPAGGFMTGELGTVASTIGSAGFNIAPGVAPTNPNNGDMWTTAGGLYVRIAGSTYQLGGSSLALPVIVDLGSGTSEPAPGAGAAFQAYGADGVASRHEATAFNNGITGAFGIFDTRTSLGTRASPSAVTAGTQLGSFEGKGYDSSVWSGTGAAFHIFAELSTWTAISHPGEGCIATTPTGGTATVENFCVHQDGGATLGTSVSDEGAFTFNLQGNLYNNGTAPTGTGAYVRATSPAIVTPTVTGTSLPASSSGQTVISGTQAGFPVLSQTGQTYIYNTTADGAVLQGDGTTYDVAILDKAGGIAIGIPTNTPYPAFPSLVSGTCANGIALNSSNQMVLQSCPSSVQNAIAGTSINLRASLATAGSSVSISADGIIVCTALTSASCYELGSYAQSFNGSTTGAGGMDTGSLPTSGYVCIYAIYNPTAPATSILGTNCTTSSGSVYSGSNMPSGYTASALLASWPTNSTPALQVAYVRGRFLVYSAAIVSITTGGSYHSLSIPVPPNAISFNGYCTITISTTTGSYNCGFAADSAGTGQQVGGVGSSAASSTNYIPFTDITIATAQTTDAVASVPSGATAQLTVGGYRW